jgi:rhodanese-related sulfurtransferase
MLRGQPTPVEKFALLGEAVQKPVAERAVFVHPGEVVALRKDLNLQVTVLDLRDEHDFNLFHVGGARRLDPVSLARPEVWKPLVDQPASTVTFLVANGEAPALEAWKALRALGASNLYVVEGGMNSWLALYPVDACVASPAPSPAGGDPLAWRFTYATGSLLPSAWPELPSSRAWRSPCSSQVAEAGHPAGHHGVTWPDYLFERKVKLQSKASVKGGCG